MAVLEVNGLKKVYTTRFGGSRVQALTNVTFAVERGEIVDLVGPSGSGKSSLLTACARLNPHAHGAFALEGKGSGEFTPQQWRRDVAYLPQKPILTGKNVAEAIRLPWTLAIRGKGGKGEHLLPDERIRTTLDAMGCEDIDLERAPHDLSGGQAQRVVIARAIINEPKVILADEPMSAIDVAARIQILDTFAAIRAARPSTAIIMVSHDLGVVQHIADRILVLCGGKVSGIVPGRGATKRDVGLMMTQLGGNEAHA